MRKPRSVLLAVIIAVSLPLVTVASAAAAVSSLGGFIPFVGMGLTDEADPNSDTFFIAVASDSWGGSPLGPGSSAYFDLALLDTGAATHILTPDADVAFNIAGEGFGGEYTQAIGTAGGIIELDINLPLGVYAAGLGDRTSAGTTLTMNTSAMRGQTSVSTLSAPNPWDLPNIIGLPMAAQHAVAILNDDPQIFEYQGRTVRTPQVEFRDLGSGGGDIVRRAPLKLNPGDSFITGPLYQYTLDFNTLDFVPTSPTVVVNAGLYVDVDMTNGEDGFDDQELLLDTGADLTVLSQITAKRLGFDAVLDTPDFYLEVESPGGIESGVPGIFVEELNIDTVGGSFTLYNVPVAVLDVPNPSDPGNVVDGILGMNVFNGRNLVIDANPLVGQGGVGPSLYIGDPVAQMHSWDTAAVSGSWITAGNWDAEGVPAELWHANVANVSGSDQTAVVSTDSQIYTLDVSGTPSAQMTVEIESGATLTTFGETYIGEGGRVLLSGGMLDTQFVNIEGGTLSGEGEILAGTGPINSPVRNLSGRVEPGDPVGQLTINGDFSNQADGTLAVDLGGTTAVTQYDVLAVDRYAFLAGTLEVSLVDLGGGVFAPGIGNAFTILTATEGISGTFDDWILPSGYQWDVSVGTYDVVLTVTGLGLAGDYNDDGTIDAADYTVWRDVMTAGTGPLPNDPTPGTVDESDFEYWRAHYGESSGSGAGAGGLAAVPEPATAVLLLAGLAGFAAAGRCLRRA